MNMISKEYKKKRGLRKFFNSFTYPINGLRYAYKNEQNLFIDILITAVVITFAIVLKVSIAEWIILIITMGLVISAELFNTAIEAVVDLNTQKYHPLARVAKDTSSAAVLVLAIVAIIEGVIIFLPKILKLI